MYYKSYKFRLYPSDIQEKTINKTFETKRFIYNYFLSLIIENYSGQYENMRYYQNHVKHKHDFLRYVDDNFVKKILQDLDKNYMKACKDKKFILRFKSKNDRISYGINSHSDMELNLKSKTITLPILGVVKVRGYKNIDSINGKIMSVTISKELNGKYYISVLYLMNEKLSRVKPNSIVGSDLGVKNLLTLSDGTVYENSRSILKYEKRINRMQKALSRKVKGSENYKKCKQKLAVLHSKLTNARKKYIQEITKEITDNFDIIVCESLHTKDMIMDGKNTNLSKNINDVCFKEILRQLEYKSRFKGKEFYQINEYYPSSQVCSRCDSVNKKYKDLSLRDYKCDTCLMEIDRDLNAGINIMFEGFKMYMNKYKKYF